VNFINEEDFFLVQVAQNSGEVTGALDSGSRQ
jgi:hypothetical protein